MAAGVHVVGLDVLKEAPLGVSDHVGVVHVILVVGVGPWTEVQLGHNEIIALICFHEFKLVIVEFFVVLWHLLHRRSNALVKSSRLHNLVRVQLCAVPIACHLLLAIIINFDLRVQLRSQQLLHGVRVAILRVCVLPLTATLALLFAPLAFVFFVGETGEPGRRREALLRAF